MLDYSREFIEVAMCLNYERAAFRLNVSTSTLSRHIADLEKQLGFKLFDRNPLRLTAAGKCYLESISDLIAKFDKIVELCRAVALSGRSQLSVWYLPSNPVSNLVQEVASQTESAFPGLSIRFCVDDSTMTAVEALLESKADIAVLYTPLIGHDQQITCETLCHLPICAWVHKDNPVLKSHPTSLSDLSSCSVPVTVVRQAQDWSDSIRIAFESCGHTPEAHLRTLYDRSSFYRSLRPDEVLLDFVGDDTPLVCNSDLARVDLTQGLRSGPVFLAYRAEQTDPSMQFFIDRCRAVARAKYPE